MEYTEWASPVVIVPKKNGKLCVCVDYKPLNAATKRNYYPLPFQDEILNEVAGHERYSVMDGYSGYFQISIAKEDQFKTTFITPWGCFAYHHMPFGLLHVMQPFKDGWIRYLLNFFVLSWMIFVCIVLGLNIVPSWRWCSGRWMRQVDN